MIWLLKFLLCTFFILGSFLTFFSQKSHIFNIKIFKVFCDIRIWMDFISVYIPILGSFSKILTTTQQNEMKTTDNKDGTKLIYQHLEQQCSGKPAKNCPRMVHKISQTLIKPILNSMPQKALKFFLKYVQNYLLYRKLISCNELFCFCLIS